MKKLNYTIRVAFIGICLAANLSGNSQNQPVASSNKLSIISGKAKSVSSNQYAKSDSENESPLSKVLRQSNAPKPYIYPNPVKDVLSVKAISNQASLEIISVLGKPVGRYSKQNTIDITLLPVGIYYLRIQDQGVMNVLRFIKQ